MEIVYTTRFARAYRKLPLSVKREAEKKEQIFRQNPFDHRLKTHQLKGRLAMFWSFSVTYKYRIIFELHRASRERVSFHDVGDHDVYQ